MEVSLAFSIGERLCVPIARASLAAGLGMATEQAPHREYPSFSWSRAMLMKSGSREGSSRDSRPTTRCPYFLLVTSRPMTAAAITAASKRTRELISRRCPHFWLHKVILPPRLRRRSVRHNPSLRSRSSRPNLPRRLLPTAQALRSLMRKRRSRGMNPSSSLSSRRGAPSNTLAARRRREVCRKECCSDAEVCVLSADRDQVEYVGDLRPRNT